MTFCEAIEQMAKGRVVCRRSWPAFAMNYGVAIHIRESDRVLRLATGDKWSDVSCWMPFQVDIFASDWEVVEATPPTSASQ